MNLPKLIITDLDGTLLPESKRMTEKTRSVMNRLSEMGVTIALASGKFYHLTQHYAEQLGPHTPVIALDGARITFNSQEVRTEGIPPATILELLDMAGDVGAEHFADSGNDELLLNSSSREIPLSIRHWAERIHQVPDIRPHLEGDPAILAVFGSDREALREYAEEGQRRFPGLRHGLYPSSAYGTQRVTFQREDVTKGSGVLALCRHYGVEPDQCMVFGDWFNDLPMFRVGATNVAMINAQEALKAEAQYLTEKDCESDGVADFLEKAFL